MEAVVVRLPALAHWWNWWTQGLWFARTSPGYIPKIEKLWRPAARSGSYPKAMAWGGTIMGKIYQNFIQNT